MAHKFSLHKYLEGLRPVDVGITALPLDQVPDEYREHLQEVQRAHHNSANQLMKAISKYDTDSHDDHARHTEMG